MYRRIIILAVLACFCQSGLSSNSTTSKPRRDIQFDKDPIEGSGRGSSSDAFMDDEDLAGLGSGSGSGSGSGFTDSVEDIDDKLTPTKKITSSTRMTTTMPTTSTTTPAAKYNTQCLRMRKHSQRLPDSRNLPRCTPTGEFDSLQCRSHPGTDDCWCSDKDGTPIPGTHLSAPNIPGCDDGYNLPPCVYQLVKNIRSRLYGAFRPHCAPDGQFERMQCHGSMCFCVDEESGKKVANTERHKPAKPNCDDDSLPVEPDVIDETTEQGSKEQEVSKEKEKDIDRELEIIDEDGKDTITVDNEEGLGGIDVSIKHEKDDDNKSDDDNSEDKDEDDDDDSSEETNRTGKDHEDKIEKEGNPEENKSRVADSQILTQPGLLGGIIGGSVVLLLGLVLLIMFIVYRMRKKDEGSYPLDEPRKLPNYSYVRAPEKEYYA